MARRSPLGTRVVGEDATVQLQRTIPGLRGLVLRHPRQEMSRDERDYLFLAHKLAHALDPKHFPEPVKLGWSGPEPLATRFIRTTRTYRIAQAKFYEQRRLAESDPYNTAAYRQAAENSPEFTAHMAEVLRRAPKIVSALGRKGIVVNDNPVNVGIRANNERDLIFFEIHSLNARQLARAVRRAGGARRDELLADVQQISALQRTFGPRVPGHSDG